MRLLNDYLILCLSLAFVGVGCREGSGVSPVTAAPESLGEPAPTALFSFGRSEQPCDSQRRIFVDPLQPTLFVSYLQGIISGWDVAQGRQLFEWKAGHVGLSEVFDGVFLPSGQQILLAGTGGISQVNLWDGSQVAAYDNDDKSQYFEVRDGKSTPAKAIKSYFAIGMRDDGRVAAATAIASRPHRVPDPMMFAFSPIPVVDAYQEQAHELTLLDLEQKKTLSSVSFKDSFIYAVRFSNNHKFVITVSYLRIRFWDVSDPFHISLAREIRVSDFVPGRAVFVSAAVSANMKLIAVATRDEFFVFSSESGLIIPSLYWKQEKGFPLINYLQWSASGQELIGSNLQGKVFVWSVNRDISYSGFYQLENNSTFVVGGLERNPYVPFAVDPGLRYLVRPRRWTTRAGDRACAGMEVMKLPELARLKP